MTRTWWGRTGDGAASVEVSVDRVLGVFGDVVLLVLPIVATVGLATLVAAPWG